MAIDLAAPIQAPDKRRSRTLSSSPGLRLQLAERPVCDRVQRLVELTRSLLIEAQALSRDRAVTAQSVKLQTLNVTEGLDFYDEVKNFETGLIRLALEHSGGNQAMAAKLLKLNATTLNSKIKALKIEY